MEDTFKMSINTGNPDKPYKIYQFVPKSKKVDIYGYPGNIDYKKELTIRLARKDTFENGFLIKTEYYESYDAETQSYNNIVLDVETDYVYEGYMINRREKKWYYYDEDEIRHLVKDTVKFYLTTTEKRTAGRRRRENVLNTIDLTVVGMLYQAGVFDMTTSINNGVTLNKFYKTQIIEYRDDNTNSYYNALATDTEFPWLDTVIQAPSTTIRMWALNELTYAEEPFYEVIT